MYSLPARSGEPRRSRRNSFLLIAAFLLGGLVLPNLHITWRAPSSGAQPVAELGVMPAAPPAVLAESESYARAARIASPAIVNIDATQRVRVNPSFWDDDWMQGSRIREAVSQGSGVIINNQGDILTNQHVVGETGETRQILVTTQDGRKLHGTVIGADRTTDVALVHVDGANLKPASVGTVRGLVPGQMAIAIGNPYGLGFTVTHGVVSALGRPIVDHNDNRTYENLIQTDCAINPGNSGGALVNLQGQVIGINTIVLSQAQGIGFAIPIDMALMTAQELKRYGHVKRPWLGITVVTNSELLSERFGLSRAQGAVVNIIYRDGPAADANFQQGDVITRLNGKPIRSSEDFKNGEKGLKIGQQASIEVQRPGQGGKGVITVGEAP